MKSMVQRYFWFFVGVAINSFGVAFITQAALSGLAKVARAQVTGNGSSKTLSVSHQLGAVPIVYIYKGGQQYLTDIASTSTQVTLSFNTAPASGTVFDLILIG